MSSTPTADECFAASDANIEAAAELVKTVESVLKGLADSPGLIGGAVGGHLAEARDRIGAFLDAYINDIKYL